MLKRKRDSGDGSPKRRKLPDTTDAGSSKSPDRTHDDTLDERSAATRSSRRLSSEDPKTEVTSTSPIHPASSPVKAADASKSPRSRASFPVKSVGASKNPTHPAPSPVKATGIERSPGQHTTSDLRHPAQGGSSTQGTDATEKTARYAPSPDENSAVTDDNARRVLDYWFLPSLEHIAGSIYAQSLWMQKNVTKKLRSLFDRKVRDDYFISHPQRKPTEVLELEEKMYTYTKGLMWQYIRGESRLERISEEYVNLEDLYTYIRGIAIELLNWQSFHDDVCGSPIGPHRHCISWAAANMDLIVWSTTGCIHYEATADKMLDRFPTCNALTRIQKYRLCCAYCREGRAKDLADLRGVGNYIDRTGGRNALIIAYWGQRLLAEGTQGRQRSVAILQENEFSEERRDELLCKHAVRAHNDFVLKYVCEGNPSMQSFDFIGFFSEHAVKNVRILYARLCGLSRDEQLRVLLLQNNFAYLLDCLVEDWLWVEFYLKTYGHFKGMITNDMLANLMVKLGETLIGQDSYSRCKSKSSRRRERYRTLLQEIWRDMTREQIEYMFDHNPGEFGKSRFVDKVLPYLDWQRLDDYLLLQDMLSRAGPTARKTTAFSEINVKKCTSMLPIRDWNTLDRVTELLLVSERDKDEFKMSVLSFRDFGDLRIAAISAGQGDHAYIEELLEWAISSPVRRLEFKQEQALNKGAHAILHVIFNDIKHDEDEILEFLTWCLGKQDAALDFRKHHMENIVASVIIDLVWESQHEIPFRRPEQGQAPEDPLVQDPEDILECKASMVLSWQCGNDPLRKRAFKENFLPKQFDLLTELSQKRGLKGLLHVWFWCFGRNYKKLGEFMEDILRCQFFFFFDVVYEEFKKRPLQEVRECLNILLNWEIPLLVRFKTGFKMYLDIRRDPFLHLPQYSHIMTFLGDFNDYLQGRVV